MTPASHSLARTAWLVVALLLPVALLNYMDRQLLAVMKFSVMGDITDIGTDANWGRMLGQFKWVYAFCSPIGGYIADRFSRRITICGSLFAWSLITWITGHVQSYEALLWTRSLMGISEAFYIPAALALIADYHSGGTRSRAVGVHQMAIYCGVIIGGFAGHVADAPDLGWRWAFNVCGIIGVIYTLPLILWLRDAPRDASSAAAPGISPLPAAKELMRNRSFILLLMVFTLPAMAAWVVRDWMPAILKQEFNIGQGKAGVTASLYWQLAAIFGALIGGWLADRWMMRGNRGRIFVSAIGISLIIPALFGVGNAGSLMVAAGFLALFGFGWGFFDSNNMPILTQIVRPELRATGYGVMNLVSMTCGGFADWGFGYLRDRAVPLNVVLGLFALIPVISILFLLGIRPLPESSSNR